MEIRLTAAQVAEAEAMAAQTYERWKDEAGYYGNRPDKHRTGKLGEVAVESWLVSGGITVESPFRTPDRESEADLVAYRARLEVKTWDSSYWHEWGRCVQADQAEDLSRKADVVVWCSLSESSEAPTVAIHGYSDVGEVLAAPIRRTGPPWRKVTNYQIDLPLIRPLDELLKRLAGPEFR